MLRMRLFGLALFVMACSTLGLHAQDDAIKAILRKAIDAHGGETLLLRYQAVISKFKGVMEIQGVTFNINGESTIQKPDKMKNSLTYQVKDKTIQSIYVYNGRSLWVSTLGKTNEVTDEKLIADLRETMQAESVWTLMAMLEKSYELAYLGEGAINGRTAIGIRVSKKGQRDFNIYFDKKSYLLVKIASRAFDAMSKQEVTQEKYFSQYKELNGIRTPGHVAIHKSGKPFMNLEITETKLLERLDDSHFTRP